MSGCLAMGLLVRLPAPGIVVMPPSKGLMVPPSATGQFNLAQQTPPNSITAVSVSQLR